MCTDETSCDWEKITACAFDAAGEGAIGAHIAFMGCMDASAPLPLFYAPAIPKACAAKQNLDWTAISACFAGERGTALIKAAENEVVKHLGKGAFHIPIVQVDGQVACVDKGPPETKYPACDYGSIASLIGGGDDDGDGDDDTTTLRVSDNIRVKALRGSRTATGGGGPEINVFFASV